VNQIRGWGLIALVSLAVMIPFSAPYWTMDPSRSRVPIESAAVQYPALIGHIAFAFIALLAGLFQGMERLRLRKPRIHRTVGLIYAGSVGISGLLSLVVIFYIENFAKAVSFLALSLIWLYTTWKGYRLAMCKRWGEHRKWMARSFGMTLVAVSGRALVPVLLFVYVLLHGFSLPGGREQMVQEVLNVNIWAGLTINFLLVEWVFLGQTRGAAR